MVKRRYLFAAAIAVTACVQAVVTDDVEGGGKQLQSSDPIPVEDTAAVLENLYVVYESQRADRDLIINWSDPHAGYAVDSYHVWDKIWLQALVDWAEHSPYNPMLVERDNWVPDGQLFNANDAQVRQYYLGAAKYCLDNDRDLSAALSLVNEVISFEPGAYWAIYLKACILAKMGAYESAARDAVKCREQAVANNDFDYFNMSGKLIASIATVEARK